MDTWSQCTLGDLITLKRGYDLPQQKRRKGAYPILSSSGVSGYHNEYMVPSDGVVTGRYGTIGEVFYCRGPHWPLNTTLYVDDFHGNDKKFVYYFMKTLDWKGFSIASAVPGINRNHVHTIPIHVPPVETQRTLAAILSSLDDRIANNTAINHHLEQIAQALYADFMTTNEGSLVKLQTLCTFQEGYVNPSQSRPDYFDGTIKWLRAVDINESFIFDTSRTLTDIGYRSAGKSSLLFKPDTIAISKSGTIGRLGFVADYMCGNRAVINIAPHDTNFLPFVYLYLKSRQVEYQDLAVGSVQKNLYVPILQDLDVVLPSLDAVLEFCRNVRPLFEQWKGNVAESRNLAALRDTLLPRLISGELSVADLDDAK